MHSLFAVTFLIAFVLPFCKHDSVASESAPRRGGVLRIGSVYDITTLNPFIDTRAMDTYARSLVFEGLTTVDANNDIVPALAESWTISLDGKEYTFVLRKGIRFHNGKELQADDVKWSVEYIREPANKAFSRSYFTLVERVEVPNSSTVKFHLQKSYAPFLESVRSAKNLVVVPKDSQIVASAFPPGTGPYILTDWKPGGAAQYKRFPQYWQGDAPYLDGVSLKAIPDESIRFNALRAGDIDVSLEVPPHVVSQILAGKFKDLKALPPYGFQVKRFRFNLRKPPFDNVKVRQAVAFALNKKEILDGSAWGVGEVTNQRFPKSSFWHLPVKDRDQDTQRAQALLREAGHPNGFTFKLPVHVDSLEVAQIVKGQLAKIGINTEMETMERAAYRDRIRRRDFSIVISGAGLPVDPDGIYYESFYSGLERTTNESGYSNPLFDRLVEDGRSTVDPAKRKEIYKKAVEILQEEVPEIFIQLEYVYTSYKTYVKNFTSTISTELGHFHKGGLAWTWVER